jgi:hypothetical protein
VKECTCLTGHCTLRLPSLAQFGCLENISITFFQAHSLGIELAEEHTYDVAYGTEFNPIERIAVSLFVKRELAILLKFDG